MNLPIKLLGLAGLLGATATAAIVIDRRRRRLTGSGAGAPSDLGVASDLVIVDAEIVGIADVDPELLTQMGEAIDPERTARAHEEIPEQRAKLPKR